MDVLDLVTGLTAQAEGFRSRIYLDTRGYETIGYGDRMLGDTAADLERFRTAGISEPEARTRLRTKLAALVPQLAQRLWFWNQLSTVRQAVLIDMAYQLGVPGLLEFRLMLGYCAQGLYILAAQAGLKSKWAAETPKRADHRMALMEDGKLLPYDASMTVEPTGTATS